LVGVWPIGMQVAFFSTLYFNRKELKAGVQTPHTSAIKFLTGGYKPDFFYWETVELFRRLTCSGFVILIPHDYIFGRIALALFVSVPILMITALLKPFKNIEDTMLALFSQALLIFAFLLSALIRILNSTDLTDQDKLALLGFTSAAKLFFGLGGCCLAFLLMLLGAYMKSIWIEFNKLLLVRGESAEGSTWIIGCGVLASLFLLAALGTVLGIAGGIIGAAIAFPVGTVLGGMTYPYCASKPSVSRKDSIANDYGDGGEDCEKPAASALDRPQYSFAGFYKSRRSSKHGSESPLPLVDDEGRSSSPLPGSPASVRKQYMKRTSTSPNDPRPVPSDTRSNRDLVREAEAALDRPIDLPDTRSC